ncbi:MAG: nickel pincer cofactor biosynthesis protein LarC [Thermodesulfovibrionales bacterium]|nr:nickel pincer cofactor biosynthesis protein LarC [Thermodesulfovibrionales bacterium]
MKIAYFDCFSGISGDMCLGAIVDAGVSLQKLKKELKKIPIGGYGIRAKKVKRAGFSATKVNVIKQSTVRSQKLEVRRWKNIEKIIRNSSLSQEIKQKGLHIFKRIFEAEARVHGEAFDNVHLHELGDIDCLIDIFGTIIGLDMLGAEKVYSSPVNLGSGSVKTEHGILPVPAPATAEILRGAPIYSTDISFELTTPTGAALLKELSSGFVSIPSMTIQEVGSGAGSKDFKDRPNVLRLFVGDQLSKGLQDGEKATVIETNIDDMNPQVYEYVMEKLFKTGALDVFLTQVLMKKGRPGIKLTVLCKEADRERLIRIIMKETTTIGLRIYEVKRAVLQREIKLVDTEFGKVRVKFSRLGDEILKAIPEYEDCKRIAKRLKIPLVEIMKRISISPKA